MIALEKATRITRGELSREHFAAQAEGRPLSLEKAAEGVAARLRGVSLANALGLVELEILIEKSCARGGRR